MKTLYCFLFISLIFTTSVQKSLAQIPNYGLVAKNLELTASNQLEFDVYILWTNSGSSDPFNYGSCQYCFTFNPIADDGQTWTLQIIGSDLPVALQPVNPQWNAAISQLRFAGNLPGPIFQVSSAFPGTKVMRVRLSSNNTFPAVPLNLLWRNTGSGLIVKISYTNPNGNGVFITDTTSHSVVGGNICLGCNVLTPSLVNPANNSEGNLPPIAFIWRKASEAVNYSLQIATDSLMSNLVVNDSLITDTSRVLSNFDIGTKYFWLVKSRDSANNLHSSLVWNFTTRSQVPILVSPANNSTNILRPVNFIWLKAVDAVNYFLKVATDSLMNNLVVNDSLITDTVKTISTLNAGIKYYWLVKSRDSLNNLYQSLVWNFTTQGGALPTYTLTARNFQLHDTLGGDDNVLKFDINLQWINQGSSDPFNYGSCQYCFTFNPLIDDGQIWDFDIVNSHLPSAIQPVNPSWDAATSQLRMAGNLPGPIFLVNSIFPGTLVASMRLTTNIPTFPILPLNLRWRNAGAGLIVKISYLNPSGTGVFITDTSNHTVDGFFGPLPIELSNFTSAINRNNVQLNWTTSSETNNRGFELQRSMVNSEWAMVNFIEGAGNSNVAKNYSYEDKNLASGKYKYRLKQIDFNGNFEYFNLSNEVSVGTPEAFDLAQNYPNPFNPTTKINYDLPIDGHVTLIIYDISGREVSKLVNENETADYYSVSFNGSNLASGMYFYRISVLGNGKSYSMTKKMLLVK